MALDFRINEHDMETKENQKKKIFKMCKMRAYVQSEYGEPGVLRMQHLVAPASLNDYEVLIKAEALSINPAELHKIKGSIWMVRMATGLFKPKNKIISSDFAGTIVKVGKLVGNFNIGDKVFGRAMQNGLAQFITANEDEVALIKNNLSYSNASSLPLVATTALQALKACQNNIEEFANKKVLVNGASGGIGTILTQLLSHYKAQITVVCSSENFELMTNLGADSLVDYKLTDINNLNRHYDYVFDVIGNLKAISIYKLLGNNGQAVLIGYTSFSNTFRFILKSLYVNLMTSKKFRIFNADTKKEDLEEIMRLVAKGYIQPVIHKVFPFSHLVDAFKLLGTRRVKGKIAIEL